MPPPRNAAFAVARARLLSAPSPRESTGSTVPSSVRQSEASLATPSTTRSRSWTSQATSGGSSMRSGLAAHDAVGVVPRRLDRLVPRLGERLDEPPRASCSSRMPLGGERDERVRDVGARGEPVGGVAPPAALERDERAPMRRLEERVCTRGRVGEKAPVGGLQPSARCRRRPCVGTDAVRSATRSPSGRRCHATSTAAPPSAEGRSRSLPRFGFAWFHLVPAPSFIVVGHDPCTEPLETTRLCCSMASSIAVTTPSVSSHFS